MATANRACAAPAPRLTSRQPTGQGGPATATATARPFPF